MISEAPLQKEKIEVGVEVAKETKAEAFAEEVEVPSMAHWSIPPRKEVKQKQKKISGAFIPSWAAPEYSIRPGTILDIYIAECDQWLDI